MRFASQLADTVSRVVVGLWGLGCSLFGARLGFPMRSMNEILVSILRWLTSRTLLSRRFVLDMFEPSVVSTIPSILTCDEVCVRFSALVEFPDDAWIKFESNVLDLWLSANVFVWVWRAHFTSVWMEAFTSVRNVSSWLLIWDLTSVIREPGSNKSFSSFLRSATSVQADFSCLSNWTASLRRKIRLGFVAAALFIHVSPAAVDLPISSLFEGQYPGLVEILSRSESDMSRVRVESLGMSTVGTLVIWEVERLKRSDQL